MMLPNYLPPMEGEAIYSYFSRLGFANGLSGADELFRAFASLGEKETCGYEMKTAMSSVPEMLGISLEETRSLYLQTSSFSFRMPLLPAFMQTSILNAAFRESDKGSLFRKLGRQTAVRAGRLKMCPECRKRDMEEHGFFYFHKAHQLAGVSVCPEHKTPLLQFDGNYGMEFTQDTWSRTEVHRCDMEAEYAEFAKKLSEAAFDITTEEMKQSIQNRFYMLGNRMSSPSELEWIDKKAKDVGLLTCDEKEPFSKMLIGKLRNWKTSVDPRTLYTVLKFLDTDIDELYFVRSLDRENVRQECRKRGFEICGDIYENIPVIARCSECGYEFVTNLNAILSGWGCPKCDAKKADEDVISDMVERCGGGKYHFLGFESEKTVSMKLHHDACGEDIKIPFTAFVSHGQRCSCEKCVPEGEMKRRVTALGTYELVKYRKVEEKMLVRNTQCGHEFQITYGNLAKMRGECPVCDTGSSRAAKRMEQTVKDLTGDEYELIRWIDHEHVKILHKTCGKVTTYRYDGFTHGVRCSCEVRPMDAEQFRKFVVEASSGRYFTEKDIEGVEKIHVYDKVKEEKLGPFKKRFIVQELTRPTPSDVLPFDRKEEGVEIPRNSLEKFLWALRDAFGYGMEFGLRDACEAAGGGYSSASKKLSRLYKQGALVKAGKNRYMLGKGE